MCYELVLCKYKEFNFAQNYIDQRYKINKIFGNIHKICVLATAALLYSLIWGVI